MPIIKDKQISENTWTFVADDCPLPENNITVTLKRWLENRDQLLKHASKVGIRLVPSDQLEPIGTDLPKIGLVELDFPAFTDGRIFSLARLLRDRHQYQGEIRAVGHYLPDQVFYLHRVGVDAFEFENAKDLQLALSAINDFSTCYQTSSK